MIKNTKYLLHHMIKSIKCMSTHTTISDTSSRCFSKKPGSYNIIKNRKQMWHQATWSSRATFVKCVKYVVAPGLSGLLIKH